MEWQGPGVVVYGQGISVWEKAGLDADVFNARGRLVPSWHPLGRYFCTWPFLVIRSDFD
jgi:hypothetical protein